MIRKRLVKKIVTGAAVVGVTVFALVPSNVFATNFGPYTWSGTWTSTDSGVITRNVKDNDSSVRCKCTDTSTVLQFRLTVYGGDDYYGTMSPLTYNGKVTPSYLFANDTQWYMTNYVKENNKRIAALYSSNATKSGTATGVWNPDSEYK